MSAAQLIQPAEVIRDEDGYWTHPGVPDFVEDHAAFSAWLASQGLTVSASSLEFEDDDHPAYISYYDNEIPGAMHWSPTRPSGDGWFTLSIHDTEDGPVWLWARREPAVVKCDAEWQAKAMQAAMQVPPYAMGWVSSQSTVKESLTVARLDPLSDILKMVDDLVIEWVDNGMDHGQPLKRVVARKRLESAISTHFKAQPAGDEQEVAYISMLQLLPCPFCGGDAQWDHDDVGAHWIDCVQCGASTNQRYSIMDDCQPLLAEQWNRRHNLPQQNNSEQFCDGHCTWLDHHPDCDLRNKSDARPDAWMVIDTATGCKYTTPRESGIFGWPGAVVPLFAAPPEVAALQAEIARLEIEVSHWKANHADITQRAALLSQRPDLPVDRLPAYAALQARIAELEADRQVLQVAGTHPAPCARHCESTAYEAELRREKGYSVKLVERIKELQSQLLGNSEQLAECRKFLDLCATFAGRDVNGNDLARRAAILLAAAPAPESEQS